MQLLWAPGYGGLAQDLWSRVGGFYNGGRTLSYGLRIDDHGIWPGLMQSVLQDHTILVRVSGLLQAS